MFLDSLFISSLIFVNVEYFVKQEDGGNHFKFPEDLANCICLKRREEFKVRLFLLRMEITFDFSSGITPGENINQNGNQ